MAPIANHLKKTKVNQGCTLTSVHVLLNHKMVYNKLLTFLHFNPVEPSILQMNANSSTIISILHQHDSFSNLRAVYVYTQEYSSAQMFNDVDP